MGNRWRKIGILMAGYALGMGLPSYAAVSDEEFKALKELVTKQGQRIDELERAREQDKTALDQSQKVHQQDQQEIERLKQRLDETQKSATATQQKVESIPQMQPVHPIPEGSSATHNFMVVGDAEVQFGKMEGSHA